MRTWQAGINKALPPLARSASRSAGSPGSGGDQPARSRFFKAIRYPVRQTAPAAARRRVCLFSDGCIDRQPLCLSIFPGGSSMMEENNPHIYKMFTDGITIIMFCEKCGKSYRLDRSKPQWEKISISDENKIPGSVDYCKIKTS
jgi:hypothetical protein